MNTKNKSNNKWKLQSKERQSEISKLNKTVKLLKDRVVEKEKELNCRVQTIIDLKEYVRLFETLKEYFE